MVLKTMMLLTLVASRPKAATAQTPSPRSRSWREFVAAKPGVFRDFRCSAALDSILETRACADSQLELVADRG
jgi:hypothetical protein